MSSVRHERVFHWYLYTPPSKVAFYEQNLVFILLVTAASRLSLVFLWTVSLLMVALVLFVFKLLKRYSLLTGLMIKVLVFVERTFAPLTLVSRLGINLVTSPNFYCDLGNLSTWTIAISLISIIIGNVVRNLFGLCGSLKLHKYSFCHLFQKWLKILFNFWDSRIGLTIL